MNKNLNLLRLGAPFILSLVGVGKINAATTLLGDHQISPSDGDAGNLLVTGDMSIHGGIDLGIAQSAPVSAVQAYYLGGTFKKFLIDLTDSSTSILWRENAGTVSSAKMLLGATNNLTLFKADGSTPGVILSPELGRISISGSTGGIYTSAGTPLLTTDSIGKLSFGTNSLSILSTRASNKYGDGALSVGGGISSLADAHINGVTVGRGRGNIMTNTALGNSSLEDNTLGKENTAIGADVLSKNEGGSQNTAVGYRSLLKNRHGKSNVAIGNLSMRDNIIGYNNSSLGFASMRSNVSGFGNVAVGSMALEDNRVGFSNVALGLRAMGNIIDGSTNVGIGQNAGRYLVDGTSPMTSGEGNIYIGSATNAFSPVDVNSIVIGTGASSAGSNTVVIGNDATQVTKLKGEIRAENVRVSGIIVMEAPQGDISMGNYE